MQPGLVSVMMPAFNAARYVADAVQSVIAQSYLDWELVVVDDGSTDETAEIVGGFSDPRIRLLRKENGGESSARNVALDVSIGEFIAYLDADDVYLPNHLAATVAFLHANRHRDAVYTDGFHIDGTGRRLVPLQARRRGPFEGRVYEEVVRASDVFGPPMCVVLRHDVVTNHRLRYDPRIVIGPDWDFFVRFADVGTFGYLPEPTGLYRVHESNITSRVDKGGRAASLAICREKAIRMTSFSTCSVDTRVAVFYDFLIDLLHGQAEGRARAVEWREFAELPPAEQARLLRLMAADAVLHEGTAPQQPVREWLERAKRLHPADHRTSLLLAAYRLSPAFCRSILRARTAARGGHAAASPFADLQEAARESV